jgi:leader peptidase (prepilin peptidase)/N-methyltransferase
MADLYDFILEAHPWAFQLWFFLMGGCVGSFLNVCIYRIPAGKSIVFPGSHCACGSPIAWYDNIPVLSWMILRGKARCCGRSFSIRYPMIELLTAVLFLLLWTWLPPQQALPGMLFFSLLIAASFIDLDHMILPDVFTIGGMIAGVILAMLVPGLHAIEPSGIGLLDSLRAGMVAILGVIIGSGVILWMMVLAETILRKEAMGFGDVVFMGCIGAFCGWQGALFAIFGGALFGTVVVLPLMLLQKLKKQPEAPKKKSVGSQDTSPDGENKPSLGLGSAIPFGPWLALGAAVYFLILREPVDAYLADLVAVFSAGTIDFMP